MSKAFITLFNGQALAHTQGRLTKHIVPRDPGGELPVVGDTLYCREGLRRSTDGYCEYRADGKPVFLGVRDRDAPDKRRSRAPWMWEKTALLPARECPIWAVRAFGAIEEIEVKPLLKVTDAEALMGGISTLGFGGYHWIVCPPSGRRLYRTASKAFQAMWSELYQIDGGDVVVISKI